jgi:hypothetical protein
MDVNEESCEDGRQNWLRIVWNDRIDISRSHPSNSTAGEFILGYLAS